MSDSTEFLTQIFYGTDVWGYLGPLGIICVALVLVVVTKYTALFSSPVLAIMAIDYFGKISATGYYAWHGLLCFFGAIFIPIIGFVVGERRK